MKATWSQQDAVKGVVDKLRETFGNKYTPEQYHAWAQLVQLGRHSSYDEAPDYPFFADSKKKSSNKTSDVDETCSTKSTSDFPLENVWPCALSIFLNLRGGTLSL